MAWATAVGAVFGMSRSRTMSVSTGPVRTACTRTPCIANRARWAWVSDTAAALEMEYAGMTGRDARPANDRMLTTSPRDAVSRGRTAWVRSYGPYRLTARWFSRVVRSAKPS